jgi:hypothetical protein
MPFVQALPPLRPNNSHLWSNHSSCLFSLPQARGKIDRTYQTPSVAAVLRLIRNANNSTMVEDTFAIRAVKFEPPFRSSQGSQDVSVLGALCISKFRDDSCELVATL